MYMSGGGEPWDCPRVLEQHLLSLLVRLHERGVMTADQIRRHCLAIEELVPLLPHRDRLTQRYRDMASLVEALQRRVRGGVSGDPTLRKWHKTLERTRYEVSWLRFSAQQRRRAAERAEYLTDEALRREYVERADGGDLWVITPLGIQAVDLMGMSRSL